MLSYPSLVRCFYAKSVLDKKAFPHHIETKVQDTLICLNDYDSMKDFKHLLMWPYD